MALFIKGMGNISPQQTWGDDSRLSLVNKHDGKKFSAIEPEYTTFIDPKLIRRMSRIIKMGVASASMALKQADVPVPDSIITATGYGCLEDTGTFLTKMVENKEQALNPTPFIQSTHNTIGSQIALILQCQGYNQTYTHGAFSFETVLLDALLHVEENPSQQILIGGADEITPISHAIQTRFGMFENGTTNGEGSTFFVVSGKDSDNCLARIERVTTLYKPTHQELVSGVEQFVRQSPSRFDFILADGVDKSTVQSMFPGIPVGTYKHLCGEYPVSTAFATWLATRIIQDPAMASNCTAAPINTAAHNHVNTFQNLLILNSYFGTHYSLIHVTSC